MDPGRNSVPDPPNDTDANLEGPAIIDEYMPALLRAAMQARRIAKRMGTKVVVVIDGKIEHLDPESDRFPIPFEDG